MKTLLLLLILAVQRSAGWGIVDWVQDKYDEHKDTVIDTWDTLGAAISDAAEDVTTFFTEGAGSVWVAEIVSSVTTAFEVLPDKIEDAIPGFNATSWRRMAKGAKMVAVGLPEQVKDYITTGVNYLADKLDLDVIPYPLDSIKDDDLYQLSQCIGPEVYELAVDWTKEVATTFTSIVGEGGSFDFTPLLNTENVEPQLNSTYMCLARVGAEIKSRAKTTYDNKGYYMERMAEYFELTNLTITLEISFTACTLTCGTASLGFAVNTEDYNDHRAFYTVAMGVDSSNVIGAAIGARLGFRPDFNITGHFHGVKFGIQLIKIPLLPSLPDITIAIDADEGQQGDFAGFLLKSDIIDLSLGVPGVFALGYSYTDVKWVQTLADLELAWNAAGDIAREKIDVVNSVVQGFKTLKDELKHGGYYMKAGKDAVGKLMCPSGVAENHEDNQNIGDLSVLQLGMIEIYNVVYGNLEGQHECNSSYGYANLRAKCQWGSDCEFEVNAATLGFVSCDTEDIDLSVIYGCPNQLDVFNLGCYTVKFIDVIDRKWYQDQTSDLLDDGWQTRTNGIAKCAKLARDAGYDGFAMYNGGMCLMADTLFDDGVYNEHGGNVSANCPVTGLGNDVLMNMYAFAQGDVAYDELGCINSSQIEMYDTEHRTDLEDSFQDYEGEHFLFQDDYQSRDNAMSKCAQFAYQQGYRGFALSDGGKCVLSDEIHNSVVADIKRVSNVSNDTDSHCGLGTEDAYMAFSIAGWVDESKQEEEGLPMWAIITAISVLFICIVVASIFAVKKLKNRNKSASGSSYVSMYQN